MWPVGVENEVKATHKRLLFFWLNHKMTNGTGLSKRILRIISLTQCLEVTKKSLTLQHCELQFQLSCNFSSILARKLKKKKFESFCRKMLDFFNDLETLIFCHIWPQQTYFWPAWLVHLEGNFSAPKTKKSRYVIQNGPPSPSTWKPPPKKYCQSWQQEP